MKQRSKELILTFSISPGLTMKSLKHYEVRWFQIVKMRFARIRCARLNGQAAIRTGKLRIIPGTEARVRVFVISQPAEL
jgi:hypothetical protein